jgi:integrase/recombinase XerD
MLKQAIEEYLLWMIEAGYCRKAWNRTERILGYFLESVQSHRIPMSAVFTPSTLSAFEKEHKDKPYAGRRVRGLWQYLFRQGKINEPLKKKKQLPETYEEYLLYYGRRVLPDQVQGARKVLSGLNDYLAEHTIALCTLKIGDLDNFLARHTTTFTAKVRRNKRYYLQGFLRYLHYERKILKKDLAPLLVGPPVFAQAKPPKFLRPHEVKRLFDNAKPTNAWGLRAYAMLYLAYTLGARSKEISLLTLDDISFSKKEVRLCDRKNTHPLTLPLPEDAIKAIAAYIVGARPKSSHRTLFLSLQPPYGPLCSAQVARNITKLFRQAHVPGSAYWLRHTYAQNLLERGASIYEIKEMLGHESIQSAQNYLRVNTKLMREVLFDDETL